ncbi:hypothetical protein DCAR_0935360 [Daucus carota subsp. sativus]|uniref:Uncharacterized protein n=1 Tax=Daucus carota subsp. sativus TaxID=79200 RepID=A0A175YHL2_DAUCS|nr:PREDICTED: pectinesterase inhibitor-like [Daucus carota subsp. sativus]WOH15814.1 hypothetical protein DCAR_0935360 [Daucus carota subsp. sativus]
MAFSYTIKCLTLLLAASLITISSADQALIKSICSKARNQALCYNIFKNSGNVDRGGLGQISTNVAFGKAQTTLNLVKSLAAKETNPKIKGQYKTCLEVYGDASDNLNECKPAFAKNEFRLANLKASAAYTDVDTCSDDGKNIAPQLKAANQENQDYIDVVMAVSYI